MSRSTFPHSGRVALASLFLVACTASGDSDDTSDPDSDASALFTDAASQVPDTVTVTLDGVESVLNSSKHRVTGQHTITLYGQLAEPCGNNWQGHTLTISVAEPGVVWFHPEVRVASLITTDKIIYPSAGWLRMTQLDDTHAIGAMALLMLDDDGEEVARVVGSFDADWCER